MCCPKCNSKNVIIDIKNISNMGVNYICNHCSERFFISKYEKDGLSELSIIRILLTWHTVSPFAVCRKTNLLVIRNLSYGFFSYGESDLIAIDNKMQISEAEVKTSITDFRKDFKKNPKIEEERLTMIKHKYYVIPKYVYEKNKEEIEQKMSEKGYGIITIGTSFYDKVWIEKGSNTFSDYKISQEQFFKLAKLVCYRQ